MDLVDVKIPKKDKMELSKEATVSMDEGDRWPWGLRLTFRTEEIAKLPNLMKLSVGDKVIVQAEARVIEMRNSERQGDKKDQSVELQIEQVGCTLKPEKKPEEMSFKEYKKAREFNP